MELAFSMLGRGRARLVICLHTSADPPQAEWEHMLQELSALLTAAPDTRHVRILVVTGGGGPDAKQRGQLREVTGEREIKTAVIVPGRANPLKRGLMTALTWMNPAMAFFTPDEFENALAHLEHSDRDSVWTELCTLQERLEAVPTLRSIAKASSLAAG